MMVEEQIQQIVREVLRRLKTHAVSVGQLRLDDRLVTLSTLDGQLDRVSRVVVCRQAVVTPAVKDLLNDKSIELIRDLHPRTKAYHSRFLLVTQVTSQPIPSRIGDLPCQVELTAASTADSAIRTVAEHVGDEHDGELPNLGAIICQDPESIACMANRTASVRAFHGVNPLNVRRAATTLQANVMVLEADMATAGTRDLLTTFVTTG